MCNRRPNAGRGRVRSAAPARSPVAASTDMASHRIACVSTVSGRSRASSIGRTTRPATAVIPSTRSGASPPDPSQREARADAGIAGTPAEAATRWAPRTTASIPAPRRSSTWAASQRATAASEYRAQPTANAMPRSTAMAFASRPLTASTAMPAPISTAPTAALIRLRAQARTGEMSDRPRTNASNGGGAIGPRTRPSARAPTQSSPPTIPTIRGASGRVSDSTASGVASASTIVRTTGTPAMAATRIPT